MLNSFYDKFIFTNSLQYRHNNFFLINMPFAMIPVDVLAAVAQKEDKELNIKLYYSIKEAIKTAVKKDFQIDFGAHGDKGLAFMESYFVASGWGKIERRNIDPQKGYALISLTNSPIAQNAKNSKAPVDTFLRAVLAGIYSIYFKKDVDCIEVKCACLGSEQCEFVVKPIHDFNFDNALTRAQLKVE